MTNPIDYEQKSRDELNELQQQDSKISKIKAEISRLRLNKKVVKRELPTRTLSTTIIKNIAPDETFEDEVGFFLDSYRQLSEDFTIEEIKAILPKKKHPQYKEILLRLSLESIKEIKEVKEVLRTEELSSDEIELCNQIIEKENRKIDYIKSKLIKSEKEEVEQEEKNIIVFAPTQSSNPRVIDELEHIPSEYYEGFKELFESIVDGTFKNVKMLTNNSALVGISEVKAFKIRVVFKRISNNAYAVITAFVKKSDTDKLYLESLENKVREYKTVENKIKELVKDPEFLKENEQNEKRLWELLSPKQDVRKKEK